MKNCLVHGDYADAYKLCPGCIDDQLFYDNKKAVHMANVKKRKEKVTVMVTGIGGGSVGEQIIKALRMARTNYYIVGVDSDPRALGQKDVDRFYHSKRADDSLYIAQIISVCHGHGVKAIFPGSEPELLKISQNRAPFKEAGVFLPINPHFVIEKCMDTGKTMEFLRANGFNIPKTSITKYPSALQSIDFFPCVLKPCVGSGSKGVYIFRDYYQLTHHGPYFMNGEVIIQEYLDGDEYTVGILTGMDGEIINSIAVKRELSGLSLKQEINGMKISTGISQGEIGKFPDVTGPCEQIAKALCSRGPLNIQGRLVDGEFYVFEINPRFSGTTSMRAMAGVNEPDLLIRKHVLNKVIPNQVKFKSGHIRRGLTEAFVGE